MFMASVQFRTAEETISAFESTDCEAWALLDGKRFMFAGIGVDELRAFLELMQRSRASNAVYTLAYYYDIDDKKKINSKLPFDGSFNFVINSEQKELDALHYKQIGYSNELESKVGALENKLDAIIEKFEFTDEKEDKLGVIGEILNHPSIASVVPMIIKSFVEKMLNADKPFIQTPKFSQVAGIGNIEKDQVLKSAIERLLKVDARLSEHLTKLADIAENDFDTFSYILSTLDNLKPA